MFWARGNFGNSYIIPETKKEKIFFLFEGKSIGFTQGRRENDGILAEVELIDLPDTFGAKDSTR